MPVSIILDTEALEAVGEQHVPDAIQVVGAAGARDEMRMPPIREQIAVHIALSRPQLEIERHSLSFGLIGRTDIETLPLEIRNSGSGELVWHSEVRGTWLEVVPAQGVCGAGQTDIVQVNAYALAVGGDSGQAWLTVHSNGGRVDLPASVALSSPALSVEPLVLDLESENYASAAQTVRITNRGVGQLRGTIQSQVSWLICEPQEFDCATGAATQITVHADLERLRGRTVDRQTVEALDALAVESNGGDQEIGARLTLVLTPQLQLSTKSITFDDTTQTSFYMENQGFGTLHAQVIASEPWLIVNRQEWTIKARKRARVRVRLVDAPADASPHGRGAASIEIRTSTRVIALPVHVTPLPNTG
jgi:hypothetical protein